MKPITKAQMIKINVLLSQLGLRDAKEELVHNFSKGRVTSTRDLSMYEASLMLKHLSQHDPCDRMRRKVFAVAYEAGIIYGATSEDRKINDAKLNMFLMSRGTVKKPLNKMNKNELIETINQFEVIIKHKNLAKAGKVTTEMLSELNIKTS